MLTNLAMIAEPMAAAGAAGTALAGQLAAAAVAGCLGLAAGCGFATLTLTNPGGLMPAAGAAAAAAAAIFFAFFSSLRGMMSLLVKTRPCEKRANTQI